MNSKEKRLMTAALNNDMEELMSAIANGARIDALGPLGDTAMRAAIRNWNKESVEALLAAGADPTRRSLDAGAGYLHACARLNSAECMMVFLARNMDPNARNFGGRTPLHLAAEYGNTQCIKALLDAGAFVDAQDQSGITPLQLAAYGKLESLELLLAQGAQVDLAAFDGERTALGNAVRDGYPACVTRLVDAGASLSIHAEFDRTGCPTDFESYDTLLEFARHKGWTDVVAAIERRALSASISPSRCVPKEEGFGL